MIQNLTRTIFCIIAILTIFTLSADDFIQPKKKQKNLSGNKLKELYVEKSFDHCRSNSQLIQELAREQEFSINRTEQFLTKATKDEIAQGLKTLEEIEQLKQQFSIALKQKTHQLESHVATICNRK